MSLDEKFAAAQQEVTGLSKRPAPPTLLQLYALFKQATVGDASGPRPGMLDVKGRAKYDAWKAQAGTSPDDAKQRYVDLVRKLQSED